MLRPNVHLGAHRRLFVFGMPMIMLLALPIVALTMASSPESLRAGLDHPHFMSAISLSLWTSLWSLILVLLTGTPLAWWLALSHGRLARLIELLVDIPVVLPPAVVGIALLHAFGREGLLGDMLVTLGIQIPFTTSAVILAQVVVSAPFYINSATAAFRRIDPDLRLVARTLGQSPGGTLWRVVLPIAWPGLVGGALISWARALGEFGATLLFAGNLPGTTQTMPLAIYMALESDVRVATALSIVLAALAVGLISVVRIFLHGGVGNMRGPGGDTP